MDYDTLKQNGAQFVYDIGYHAARHFLQKYITQNMPDTIIIERGDYFLYHRHSEREWFNCHWFNSEGLEVAQYCLLTNVLTIYDEPRVWSDANRRALSIYVDILEETKRL